MPQFRPPTPFRAARPLPSGPTCGDRLPFLIPALPQHACSRLYALAHVSAAYSLLPLRLIKASGVWRFSLACVNRMARSAFPFLSVQRRRALMLASIIEVPCPSTPCRTRQHLSLSPSIPPFTLANPTQSYSKKNAGSLDLHALHRNLPASEWPHCARPKFCNGMTGAKCVVRWRAFYSVAFRRIVTDPSPCLYLSASTNSVPNQSPGSFAAIFNANMATTTSIYG